MRRARPEPMALFGPGRA